MQRKILTIPTTPSVGKKSKKITEQLQYKNQIQCETRSSHSNDQREEAKHKSQASDAAVTYFALIHGQPVAQSLQNSPHQLEPLSKREWKGHGSANGSKNPSLSATPSAVLQNAGSTPSLLAQCQPGPMLIANFNSQTQQNPLKLKDKPIGKPGSFVSIKQNATNTKSIADVKKQLTKFKAKPNNFGDSGSKPFAQHTEYLNTPTAKHQQLTERDKRGIILSPHGSGIPLTKRKYEKPFQPLSFDPSTSEETAKKTPVTGSKHLMKPDHLRNKQSKANLPSSRSKQTSNQKLPQVKLQNDIATPTRTHSETFESYKSEIQVEIVRDEDLVNNPVYNKASFASTQPVFIDPAVKGLEQRHVKIDKQSLIIVRKHHLELKGDPKPKERKIHKSFVQNDKQFTSTPFDLNNAMLVKNTEEIKKQMKPVISMQQIIVPTSHNQSNSQIDGMLKNNIFSKTFHQNESGSKRSILLPSQAMRQDLLELSKEKTAHGLQTLRQEVNTNKGAQIKKSSHSSQVQFVKLQLPPFRDTNAQIAQLSDRLGSTKAGERASPLRDAVQPQKYTHRFRESKVTIVNMLNNMVTTPKTNANNLKKTDRLIKTKLKGQQDQPNKRQKTLATKPEDSFSRRQSISKPESRVSSTGAQVIMPKRSGSGKKEDSGQKKGNQRLQKNQTQNVGGIKNQLGQIRTDFKKGIQVSSYQTFNSHKNTQKIQLPNSEFLLSADNRQNKRSLIQMNQPRINNEDNSSMDSIAETYKDGVMPHRKFNISDPMSPTNAEQQKTFSEFSDASAASCLIPSESEKVEIPGHQPKDLRKQKLAAEAVKPLNVEQLEKNYSAAKRLKQFGSAKNALNVMLDSDRILPGYASKSLLVKDQQLANEVRVSDNRAHKALSFVGNGNIINMEQLRSFNLTDLDKKGKSSFLKMHNETQGENFDQNYSQVVGPGSLIANSNQNWQRPSELNRVQETEIKDRGQKYQPPQFLSKEIQQANKKIDQRVIQKIVSITPRDHKIITVIDKGSIQNSQISANVSESILRNTGPKILPLPQDKKNIIMASKGKDNSGPKIEFAPKKQLTGQKSSSLIVPSKESAMKSKQLLTGYQADKIPDSELYSARQTLKEKKAIKSFIIPDSKQKSFILPLPTAAQFTAKTSVLSKDSKSSDENKNQKVKKTPSKTKQDSSQNGNKLKVVQEEHMESVSCNSEKIHFAFDVSNESEMTPRTHLIAKIKKQIKVHFNEVGTMPETKVEWYKIGKVIGKGAFGKVNLAIHRLASKFVALKSINKSFMKDEAQKHKVMQEFNILRQTRHCNIVRLYESVEAPQHIVFVMEVCGGGDLLTYVRKRHKLREDVSKFLFQQIITGVKYINENGVLHRDIKLDNILLTSQGEVKICDFGVSKIVEKNKIMSEQCGTPAYIAPEVFENKGYEGYASDIWSAGVVLYAMLYGFVPFKASDMRDLHKQVIRCKPDYKDDISEAARNLLQGILERDPKKRLSAIQVLEHPWMVDATKKRVNVFTETEKQHIVDDFEYYKNVRKENDPSDSQVLPTDPFAEQMLCSIQNVDLKNISTRSIILAPFNSTRTEMSQNDDDLMIAKMMRPKNVVKFLAKVKEIDRQYELNNNAELDNGVYHHEEEELKAEQSHRGSQLDSTFPPEQLHSQLSELKLETEVRSSSIGFIPGEHGASLRGNDSDYAGKPQEQSEWQKLKNRNQHRKNVEIKEKSESFEEVQIELYVESQPALRGAVRKSKQSKKGSQISSGPKEDIGTLIMDESLLAQVEQTGFPKAHVVASLNNDELNHATTFYYLLKTNKEY